MQYQSYEFSVPKEKHVRVITNTDAKNEADDDFAIVQTLLSPKCHNVGFIAAHFGVNRVPDSMEKSYQELEAVFNKMHFPTESLLFRGAPHPLVDETTPVDSSGAQLIIREAMRDDPRPLFVTFLGPLTDLASAYLLEPRIAGRLTAIWIGGGAYPTGGQEFNLSNDIHAANVVFSSNIELWQAPKDVYTQLSVSLAELEYRVRPCGEIGTYLWEQLEQHTHEPIPTASTFRSGETWVLGDNAAIGLILHEDRFLCDSIPAPQFTQEMEYIHTGLNRAIRVYRSINSRLILEDLYCKLALFAQREKGVLGGTP